MLKSIWPAASPCRQKYSLPCTASVQLAIDLAVIIRPARCSALRLSAAESGITYVMAHLADPE
jgi:hypothetical protein